MYGTKTKSPGLRENRHSRYRKAFTFWGSQRGKVNSKWKRRVQSQAPVEFQRKNIQKEHEVSLRRYLQKTQANQEGFFMMILLAISPLLITSIAFLSVLSVSLSQYHKGHQLCRQQLLETQGQLTLIMKKLRDLNPKSQILRAKKRRAKRLLKVAIKTKVIPAIAAAKAHLVRVTFKQIKHRGRQEKWLMMARRVQIKSPIQFRRLVKSNFKDSLSKLKSPKYKFSLKPSPRLSLTPNYLPRINFENQQLASAQWSIRFKDILPDWLSYLVSTSRNLHFRCSATISRKEGGWRAVLKKDKLSLSF